MEEAQLSIKTIEVTIDNEKSYSMNVDKTTTFYELKKIIGKSANLLKNSFKIYYGKYDYTNSFNDYEIQELFPSLNIIPFLIVSNKEPFAHEDENIKVKLSVNIPCEEHKGKCKLFYCFNCKRSICTDCLAQEPANHNAIEKTDYLAPLELLMNKLFSNSSQYKANPKLSKFMECITFRENIKKNIFSNLRKLIDNLESKITFCLELFNKIEDKTKSNTNENIDLLKQFFTESFIKFKGGVKIKNLMRDENIFLIINDKLKELEIYQNQCLEENMRKYEELNSLLSPFIINIEKITEKLTQELEYFLNLDIYEKFTFSVNKNLVNIIEKSQVNNILFKNIVLQENYLKAINNNNNYEKINSFNNDNYLEEKKHYNLENVEEEINTNFNIN